MVDDRTIFEVEVALPFILVHRTGALGSHNSISMLAARIPRFHPVACEPPRNQSEVRTMDA